MYITPPRLPMARHDAYYPAMLLLLLPHLLLAFTLTEAHRCGFDELEARTRGTRVMGISRIVQPNAPHRSIDAEAAVLAGVTTWEPIRIRVFTEDLQNTSQYCTRVGQSRRDFRGAFVTCAITDILTDVKKVVLTDLLVPSAIKLHQDRLNVQRVSGNIVVDAAALRRDPLCSQFTVPTAHTTTGVSDADFVLYLSAGPTSGTTIAWATTCQLFGDGRPSVGVSNVSPKYISANPQTIRVIAHEMLHALGFSVSFFRSRSMYTTMSLRGKGPSPVLISTNVVAKAQAQYGCTTQTFMELEDQGGDGTASSHWKRRSAKDELMAGISGVGHYTALTIAAMEDMGFYKGNYANAEPMSYGQSAGCTLATAKCVVSGASQFPAMFCTDTSDKNICTSDRAALGKCDITTYKSPLASYFQYFADAAVGGSDSLMDYCPFTQEYSNTKCVRNTGLLIGGVYGVLSRCLDVLDGVKVGRKTNSQYGVCADVQCSTSTYSVKVAGASSFTACTPGAMLSLASLSSTFSSGSLTCPPYDEVCAQEANVADYQLYREMLGDGAHSPLACSSAVVVVSVAMLVLLGVVHQ